MYIMVTAIEVYSPPAERTLANVACVGGLTMSSLVPSKMFLANEAFPTMTFVARLLLGAIIALVWQANWQGLTNAKHKVTGKFNISGTFRCHPTIPYNLAHLYQCRWTCSKAHSRVDMSLNLVVRLLNSAPASGSRPGS